MRERPTPRSVRSPQRGESLDRVSQRLATVGAMAMLDEAIRACANETWDGIVPVLHDYIRIPNVSPVFDPDWRANGHMAEAVDLIAGWELPQREFDGGKACAERAQQLGEPAIRER